MQYRRLLRCQRPRIRKNKKHRWLFIESRFKINRIKRRQNRDIKNRLGSRRIVIENDQRLPGVLQLLMDFRDEILFPLGRKIF